MSYERNGVGFLSNRRGLDIEFYFGNEVLELEGGGGGLIAIGMEKVRKTFENFRVEEGIEERKPGVFDV